MKFSDNQDLLRNFVQDLNECKSGMSNTSMYNLKGKKYMRSKAQCHYQQRSNQCKIALDDDLDVPVASAYRGASKMRMVKKTCKKKGKKAPSLSPDHSQQQAVNLPPPVQAEPEKKKNGLVKKVKKKISKR